MSKYICVIPFYGNEELIENFIKYFDDNRQEKDLLKDVYIINDKPISDKKSYLKSRAIEAGFIYSENEDNIGFIKTSNIGFEIAKKTGSNIILLNSDVMPYDN
jgi:GT2 family glycosyltransferase